jgi:hypothetical protein
VEEADETEHWLEIVQDTRMASGPEVVALLAEARELRAIFHQSLATAVRAKSSDP